MELQDIKTGDVFLVTGTSFLSKGIRFFMRLYAKKYKIKYDGWVASHAGTLLWIEDVLYIAESVENGFHLREFNKHYTLKDNCRIYRPVVGYTASQQSEVVRYTKELETVSLSYQFGNFIQWPIYILTSIDLFKSKSRSITYCYESTRMVLAHIRPNSWGTDIRITPIFDFYNAKKLKVIYDHATVVK